jgi:hypothetical protein
VSSTDQGGGVGRAFNISILRASFLLGDRTTTCQGKEWVSFWNHDAEMSKSNDNRVEARECIRKANRCDDSQNRWRGSFWPKVGSCWQTGKRSQRTVSKQVDKN